MDLTVKNQIKKLRKEGVGYKKISKELNISVNTVKSFCRNNGLMVEDLKKECCRQCGQKLIQSVKMKQKKFCSNECRQQWWNAHRSNHLKTSATLLMCLNCKNTFYAYSKEQRKYCSHQCYIAHRFGGREHE